MRILKMNVNRIKNAAMKTIKMIAVYTPFRRFVLYRHSLRLSPEELCQIIHLVSETSGIEGDFVEVGCATGQTTVFINKHLDALREKTAKYICIDTFEGFTEEDILHEVEKRNKEEFMGVMRGSFRLNHVRWFRMMLKMNRVHRAVCIKTDIADYEFPSNQKIRFALLDVDLYMPTANALPKIFAGLAPGGVIVVDDCYEEGIYDGSGQAFNEFIARTPGITHSINGKLGIIRKPE